jgi:3-phosphoglycerate kinase
MLTLNILQIVHATSIPGDWMGLDVGPDATKTFNEALDTTQTIIWNGPMGVFEFEKFAAGTEVNIYLSSHRLTVVIVYFVLISKYNRLSSGNRQEVG